MTLMTLLIRRIQATIFLKVQNWKLRRAEKKILRMPTPLALERITRIRWQICTADDTPFRDALLQYINDLESIVKSRT
jgi:hypothetical protein